MSTIIATKTDGLKTLAEIDKAIGNIRTKGQALRRDSHSVLVAIIDHFCSEKGNGDRSRLNDLLLAINDSLGSSLAIAAVTWVDRFVPSLKWNQDKKGKRGEKLMDKFDVLPGVKREIRDLENYKISDGAEKGFVEVYTGNARDLPFYILERQAEVKPFDLMTAIIQLVKRAETKLEANAKHEGPHNNVTRAQVDAIKALAENLKKPEYLKEEPASEEVQPSVSEETGGKAEPDGSIAA